MAIQMRRGLKKDFDPYKMLPGEWAVSIDTQTQNQIVWMCFAAGVVKRMGTYEDFKEQISEIIGDYISEFDTIEQEVKRLASAIQQDAETIIQISDSIINTYLPQIQQYFISAQNSAKEAESYAHGGTGTRPNENSDNAKYYYEKAKDIASPVLSVNGQKGDVKITNVETADKLTTPRTISLTGDATGSVQFDGSGDVDISVLRKGCIVGNSRNANSKKSWFKFASATSPSTTSYAVITLCVTPTYYGDIKNSGILTIIVRGTFTNKIQWNICGEEIDNSKFVLTYKENSGEIDVELWVKIDTNYTSYQFEVLSEGNKSSRKNDLWTLYDNYGADNGSSSPTEGFTQIESTVMTLQNPISTDAYWSMMNSLPAENHRNTFRGKNLGSVFTDAQKAAIKNNTFNDLFVGDYWSINGISWYIVDINYWLNTGDTACTTPHLVIMPSYQLYTAQMNDEDTTKNGYAGSKMYKEGLNQAKEIINNFFGENYILKHREYLTNTVTDGHASGGAWFDSTVELPNEIQMYGSTIFTAAGYGALVTNRYTIDKTQLALMKMHPRFINPARDNLWLRDVVSVDSFASILAANHSGNGRASYNHGVRPVFGVTGGNTSVASALGDEVEESGL